METLSTEIAELIFRELDVVSLVKSSSVCRPWQNYSNNWRTWQALYFEQWPFFKNDQSYKNAVGDQWKSLYIQMHTYSRDVLCLKEVGLSNNIKRFIEEVSISPYVQNKNCLYTGTGPGYFPMMHKLFSRTEHKNNLFSTFWFNLEFFAQPNHPLFSEEFSKVLTVAKAQGKKTLLLINDFDNTPCGINPVIANATLANDFIQVVNANRDDIIMMIYSNHAYVITEPFIKLFASCKMNLVNFSLPDAQACKDILLEVAKKTSSNENGSTFRWDIDFDAISDKFIGGNVASVEVIMNRIAFLAIRRAIEAQVTENEPIHAVATMDDFTEAATHLQREISSVQGLHNDNLQKLTNMLKAYPEDFKLLSI